MTYLLLKLFGTSNRPSMTKKNNIANFFSGLLFVSMEWQQAMYFMTMLWQLKL